MAESQQDLREIQVLGSQTSQLIVSLSASERHHSGIEYAGISDARTGFRWTRLAPDVAVIVACHDGAGEVLIEGEWRPCRRGKALLAPPGTPHAYRVGREGNWEIAWAIFTAGNEPFEVTGPTIVGMDVGPMHHAVMGLYSEWNGLGQLSMIHQWLEIVEAQAARAGRRSSPAAQQRLERLWALVDANLDHPWTVQELAAIVHVSGEHLRTLCLAAHGVPPMRFVTSRRLSRAAALLRLTDATVESIAREVGYRNPFAFSASFRKQYGQPPTALRTLSLVHANPDGPAPT